ncbi:MAG: hypothetical protein JJT78_00695 [Leptospira sp.]|nr:hypothetical protein [Leptospira sp.]
MKHFSIHSNLLLLILPFVYFHCATLSNKISVSPDKLFHTPIPYEEGEKKTLTADHYIFSNERRIELYYPYVKGVGGGYIGVGTDQNLTIAAWARSEYMWLMDFDIYSVRVNQIHISLLKHCPDYNCFREAWNPKNKKETWVLLENDYKDSFGTKEIKELKEVFEYAIRPAHVPSRWKELEYMTKKFAFQSFHNDPADYNHLRSLALKNRIRAVKGDLTRKGTMQEIAGIATKMNLPIRVLYTSNAEDYFTFPQNYRENILSLPTDEKSFHVRTLSVGAKTIFGFPEGEKYPDYPFHYNVQKLNNMKEWMGFQRYLRAVNILEGRTEISKGFSVQEATPQSLGLKETGRISK